MNYAKYLAKKIISAELTPKQGCWEIYHLNWELDEPDKLKSWSYLNEGINPENMEWLVDSTEYSLLNESEKLNKAIVLEAKKLLETDFS